MSLEYRVGDATYSLSYRELKSEYEEICSLSDIQFMQQLPRILHIACIISFLKELNSDAIVSDRGVIHLIAHQLHIPSDTQSEIAELRETFKTVLRLD